MGCGYSQKADDAGQAAWETANAVLAIAGAANTVQKVTGDSGAGELHTALIMTVPKGVNAVLAAGWGRATAERETVDTVQTAVVCDGAGVFYTAHAYGRMSEHVQELGRQRRKRLRCC